VTLQTTNRNNKELRMSAIPKATDWISPDEYLEGERTAVAVAKASGA